MARPTTKNILKIIKVPPPGGNPYEARPNMLNAAATSSGTA